MNSHEAFIHIHQGCFAGTGAIVRLPQCQWSKPDGYRKISQCITTTKHSKAKTVCIFLGKYCIVSDNILVRWTRTESLLSELHKCTREAFATTRAQHHTFRKLAWKMPAIYYVLNKICGYITCKTYIVYTYHVLRKHKHSLKADVNVYFVWYSVSHKIYKKYTQCLSSLSLLRWCD